MASGQPPTCEYNVFEGVDKNTCTLYVPSMPTDALSKYSYTYPWNKFVNIKTFKIKSGKYGDNATWTLNETTGELTISGTGEMAYYSYDNSPFYSLKSSIKQVIIQEGITSIGWNAFWGCSELTSINIPNSVTSIGDHAFLDCSRLTSVTIGNSVISIGGSAFAGCSGLTSINIPNSVTEIGGYAFSNCRGLTSINIPNSVTSIRFYAFSGCSGLTSINIPNSVTSIEQSAFRGCSGLTSVTIGNSVISIGASAFADCINIEDIYFPTKKPIAIESNVFSCQNWATLHVLEKYMRVFKSTQGWRDFYFFENYVEPEDPLKKHDPNGDGNVNSADVVTIYNFIITSYGDKTKYDVNSDGNVNSADVVAIYNFIINGAK